MVSEAGSTESEKSLTVSVAALVVAFPHVFVNTARY
jgi:hypothetical protein